LGAYDPVEPCALLAERFGLWLHIDGAWGAPVLFSETHKSLLKGCHLADSVSWDAHKLMNVPMTAAVILVREKGLLRDACSGGGGDYLFHSDQNADYNLGERSIQCGRRADALKVWMSWKSIGNLGFARKIDQLQQLRADFVELIEQRDDFELLHTPTYLNVLFRYRSERIVDEEHAKRLTVALCQQLKERDISFTDRSVCKGRNGVRLILANQQIELSQLSALLDACSAICNELLDQGI
ncbi:MAG: pyridoxal phosphate-dependent decarboxylase family protein, partial [Pseudomonadales bacterium]